MLAEVIEGTADGTLCLIVALILVAVLCLYRAFVVKVVDSTIVAAVWFFLVLWLLVVT